jgi:predicted TIM-barrel fold metal-dependent hydrolase
VSLATPVIDADGHILEPPSLWDDYLEEKYRSRGIKIRRNERDLEYLEYDGKPARLMRSGVLHTLGAMGRDTDELKPSAERSYVSGAPYGSMDARERLDLIGREGIDRVVLYPTIGLLWEAEIEEAEISQAYCRAYNRWIADFCRTSGGKLVPIAHLSLTDVNAAATELERAAKDGCKGAFVAPFTHSRTAHGHPDHDPLFAKAQELDLPLGIHPTFEPRSIASGRFAGMERSFWYGDVMACHAAQVAFTTLFSFGVFDKFPRLKVAVLESGGGWFGYWIDRMDAIYEVPLNRPPLKNPPSHYLRTQCYISADPDERALGHMIGFAGEDCFFWATDFPHQDHGAGYMDELQQMLKTMPESARAKVAGLNVAKAYNLT